MGEGSGVTLSMVLPGSPVRGLLSAGRVTTLTQKGLEHIAYRHWATSGFPNVGRFAQGISARGLRDMIYTAVAIGASRVNTMGRAGTILNTTLDERLAQPRAARRQVAYES